MLLYCVLCFVFLSLGRIYECSVLCRCDKLMCQNRVVQHGIQVRLQVFNTEKKGWGVRCLDDIDKGTFVCTYSGSRRWPVKTCSIILHLLWCVPWIFFWEQGNTGLEEKCVNIILTCNMIKWTEEFWRALLWDGDRQSKQYGTKPISDCWFFSLTNLCILC